MQFAHGLGPNPHRPNPHRNDACGGACPSASTSLACHCSRPGPTQQHPGPAGSGRYDEGPGGAVQNQGCVPAERDARFRTTRIPHGWLLRGGAFNLERDHPVASIRPSTKAVHRRCAHRAESGRIEPEGCPRTGGPGRFNRVYRTGHGGPRTGSCPEPGNLCGAHGQNRAGAERSRG